MKYLSFIPPHTLDLTPDEEAYLDEQFYFEAWADRQKQSSYGLWSAIIDFKENLYDLCIEHIAANDNPKHWHNLLNMIRNDKKLDVQRAKNYPIVQLFGHYGSEVRNDFTCCPIHIEDTPSLKIYTKTNTWHCFGCHAGSDPIDLVMKLSKLTFAEAVKRLTN